MICTGHVKVYAADTNGNSAVSVSGSDVTIYTWNVEQRATLTSSTSTVFGTGYNFSGYASTDIYMNYSVNFSGSSYNNKYVHGKVQFTDTVTVNTGAVTGYTVSNKAYSFHIVNCPENINVSCIQSGNNWTFYCQIDNFYCPSNQYGFDFTVCVHASCEIYGSQLTAWRTLLPPTISISNSLSALIVNTNKTNMSNDTSIIYDALNNIDLKLIETNNRLSYTDSLGNYYTAGELLYLVYGAQIASNSRFDEANRRLTVIENTIGNIYDKLVNDSSGIASNAQNNINNAHLTEQGAQTQASSLLNGLNSGSVNFNTGIQSISSIPVSNLVSDNAKSISFWKTVTGDIMDANYLGPAATVLCILVILALTVWLLKL